MKMVFLTLISFTFSLHGFARSKRGCNETNVVTKSDMELKASYYYKPRGILVGLEGKIPDAKDDYQKGVELMERVAERANRIQSEACQVDTAEVEKTKIVSKKLAETSPELDPKTATAAIYPEWHENETIYLLNVYKWQMDRLNDGLSDLNISMGQLNDALDEFNESLESLSDSLRSLSRALEGLKKCFEGRIEAEITFRFTAVTLMSEQKNRRIIKDSIRRELDGHDGLAFQGRPESYCVDDSGEKAVLKSSKPDDEAIAHWRNDDGEIVLNSYPNDMIPRPIESISFAKLIEDQGRQRVYVPVEIFEKGWHSRPNGDDDEIVGPMAHGLCPISFCDEISR